MKGVTKFRILLIVPLLIAVCLVSLPAYAQYGGGTGEPNDPYLIYTAEQMNEIGLHKDDWDKHFKLMANVDLLDYDGKEGRPPFNMIIPDANMAYISLDGTPFTGVFDGNGSTISNFSCASTDADYIGLFRYVTGVIKNLGLIDPNVDAGTANYVGSLVGWLWWGTITNCYVEGGSVSGEDKIGGMVGRNQGTIINCYANGSVMGSGFVGGMVGYNLGTITNCCASSVVIGNTNVGGMVGRHGRDYPPWLFPDFFPDLGQDLVFLGPTDKISNCYSTSDVSGGDRVGGLVGEQTLGSTITNCYSTSSVSGNADVGGLVGAIAFPPVRGPVLYGIPPDTVSAFYSTTDIMDNGGDGQPEIRGLIPDVNNFWDTETSGQHTSTRGIGKTTAEMQTASTFLEAGWDFVGETANGTEDIWWILEDQDYPRLIWELPEGLRLRPFRAFSPDPRDGATDVTPSPILHWAPAEPTLQHDIYIGEDKEEVANATTMSSGIHHGRQPGELTTYDPGKLEWDATYYWRIDEVNEADPNNLCKGSVWSFTTANFLIVDDFEFYNMLDPDDPNSNSIFNTWITVLETTTIEVGVRVVSYPFPFSEYSGIVHSGLKAMRYKYDNSGPVYYSEATANTANLAIGQDWTQDGVGLLSLWFNDYSSRALEPMYVALANARGPTVVIYYDNPNAGQIETWMEWTIDLQKFADQGLNLTDVDTISIGFGDRKNPVSGGSGWMYFDEIRLYRSP